MGRCKTLGSLKFFLSYVFYLPTVYPEDRMLHPEFLSRHTCRSVTIVANDLTLIELDWQGTLFIGPHWAKFDQGLGGSSWPICLTVLGRLIPRSGKGFIVRSLSVLFLDEGLLIAFFDSSYVLSRLTRQFTSSPLTCEFFGDSHHQIPLMWWAVYVALWQATTNPKSASGFRLSLLGILLLKVFLCSGQAPFSYYPRTTFLLY